MKIGIQELLIVFIVALIFLGPDQLPVYAKKLGEALKEFRKFSSDATKDIRESIVEPLEEAQRPLREALEPVTELEKDVRDNVKGIQKSFADIGKPDRKTAYGHTDGQIGEDTPAGYTDGQTGDSTSAGSEAFSKPASGDPEIQNDAEEAS